MLGLPIIKLINPQIKIALASYIQHSNYWELVQYFHIFKTHFNSIRYKLFKRFKLKANSDYMNASLGKLFKY